MFMASVLQTVPQVMMDEWMGRGQEDGEDERGLTPRNRLDSQDSLDEQTTGKDGHPTTASLGRETVQLIY